MALSTSTGPRCVSARGRLVDVTACRWVRASFRQWRVRVSTCECAGVAVRSRCQQEGEVCAVCVLARLPVASESTTGQVQEVTGRLVAFVSYSSAGQGMADAPQHSPGAKGCARSC
jgi:hypothetical protein